MSTGGALGRVSAFRTEPAMIMPSRALGAALARASASAFVLRATRKLPPASVGDFPRAGPWVDDRARPGPGAGLRLRPPWGRSHGPHRAPRSDSCALARTAAPSTCAVTAPVSFKRLSRMVTRTSRVGCAAPGSGSGLAYASGADLSCSTVSVFRPINPGRPMRSGTRPALLPRAACFGFSGLPTRIPELARRPPGARSRPGGACLPQATASIPHAALSPRRTPHSGSRYLPTRSTTWRRSSRGCSAIRRTWNS